MKQEKGKANWRARKAALRNFLFVFAISSMVTGVALVATFIILIHVANPFAPPRRVMRIM
jgi:hypothetical protein